MIAGCLTVMLVSLGTIAVIGRRTIAAGGSIELRDFLIVAVAAGVALGAWSVGLVAMLVEVAA